MISADLDWVAILLKAMLYIGSIGAAGGILFYATVAGAASVSRTVGWQVAACAALIIVVEVLRYGQFQMAVAGGDPTLAFSPDMRWLAFDTPIGQAAIVRVVAAVVLLAASLRVLPISLVASLAMISSFALEGHTVSADDPRWLTASLIVLHLTVAHWWLGALLPLRAAIASHPSGNIGPFVEAFGKLALVAVAVLLIAGSVLLGLLSNWTIDFDRSYQLSFAIKVAGFAAILGVAAINKVRWTPMLLESPNAGRKGLRRSLNVEIALSLFILIATAAAVSFAPVG